MSGTGYFAEGQTREQRQQRREEELADFEELDEFEQSPAGERPADNYLLITHGLLMRIFCMCYLRWTTNEFEQVRVRVRVRLRATGPLMSSSRRGTHSN